MTIVFAGGTLNSRRDAAAAPLVVSNVDARNVSWNDFQDGLAVGEQGFFQCDTLPDGRGQVSLTANGQAQWQQVQRNPRAVHEHVRLLMRAVQNVQRTFCIMPVPVFQQIAANMQWVTDIATRNNPNQHSFRIAINGYGPFPAEWLGFEVAGRTHRAVRQAVDDACVYAKLFPGVPISQRVNDGWNVPTNRSRHVGRMRGDTPQIWADREGTVTLFHELIHHAIVGRGGHAGGFDEWVERRARNNWNANRPVGP